MNVNRLKNTLSAIYSKEARNYGDNLHIVAVLEDEGIFALTTGKADVDAGHALAALARRTKDLELKTLATTLSDKIALEFAPQP